MGSLVKIQLKNVISSPFLCKSLNIKIPAYTIINLPACYETLAATTFIKMALGSEVTRIGA
jgi:hypothetical protein